MASLNSYAAHPQIPLIQATPQQHPIAPSNNSNLIQDMRYTNIVGQTLNPYIINRATQPPSQPIQQIHLKWTKKRILIQRRWRIVRSTGENRFVNSRQSTSSTTYTQTPLGRKRNIVRTTITTRTFPVSSILRTRTRARTATVALNQLPTPQPRIQPQQPFPHQTQWQTQPPQQPFPSQTQRQTLPTQLPLPTLDQWQREPTQISPSTSHQDGVTELEDLLGIAMQFFPFNQM